MGKNNNVRKKTGKSGVITKITEITPSPDDIIDDTIPLYEVVPKASELKATVTEITPPLEDATPLLEDAPAALELKATVTEITPPLEDATPLPEDAPSALELKATVTEITPPLEDAIPLPEDAPSALELKALVVVPRNLPPAIISRPRKRWAGPTSLSPRHFFPAQGMCPLPVLFDSPPTGLEMRLDNDATHLLDRHSDNAASHLADAQSECKECADAQSRRKEAAKKEKGVFRGHPEPRQRASPSALPKSVGERGPKSTVSISSSKNDWRKRMLFIVSSAVVLLFIATGISYLVLGTKTGSGNASLTNLQPSKSTAIVTIVPLSTVVKNTYTIAMVTGQPNISQIQAKGARTISDTQSQSLQVNATGKVTTPATSATGALAISGATKAVTIPAGTLFLDKNKIALVLNAAVTLRVKGLAVNVGAHANPAGSKGNVSALDINGKFCYPNCTGSIFVVQNTAFAGGKDPQSYTFVQQSDINNAASQLENSLTSAAQGAVLSQIKASEQLVGSISCWLSSFSANQTAGARVPNVTVSVTETCLGEVYSAQPVQVLAVNLLKRDVTRLVGPGYVLVGNVLTQVLTQPKLIDTQGTLLIKIMATGTALYQFTTTETQAFAKLIAGQSLADAQALLLAQTGVAHVTINISDNPANKLPNDLGKIAFVVLK